MKVHANPRSVERATPSRIALRASSTPREVLLADEPSRHRDRSAEEREREEDLTALWRSFPPRVRKAGPRFGTERWRQWMEIGAFLGAIAEERFERPWRWFVGLTRAGAPPNLRGAGLANDVQAWADRLAELSGKHTPIVFAIEGDDCGGHLHALVSFPRTETPPTIRRGEALWKRGHARIRLYKENLGGPWYVTKDLAWALTFGCPRPRACRRSGGCRWKRQRVEAPFATT